MLLLVNDVEAKSDNNNNNSPIRFPYGLPDDSDEDFAPASRAAGQRRTLRRQSQNSRRRSAHRVRQGQQTRRSTRHSGRTTILDESSDEQNEVDNDLMTLEHVSFRSSSRRKNSFKHSWGENQGIDSDQENGFDLDTIFDETEQSTRTRARNRRINFSEDSGDNEAESSYRPTPHRQGRASHRKAAWDKTENSDDDSVYGEEGSSDPDDDNQSVPVSSQPGPSNGALRRKRSLATRSPVTPTVHNTRRSHRHTTKSSPKKVASPTTRGRGAHGPKNKKTGQPSTINPEFEPSEWILGTRPSMVPYRPQVGDPVAYFRRGHEEFWRATTIRSKLAHKKLPYVKYPTLPQAVLEATRNRRPVLSRTTDLLYA